MDADADDPYPIPQVTQQPRGKPVPIKIVAYSNLYPPCNYMRIADYLQISMTTDFGLPEPAGIVSCTGNRLSVPDYLGIPKRKKATGKQNLKK
jgi:hypothetical protein